MRSTGHDGHFCVRLILMGIVMMIIYADDEDGNADADYPACAHSCSRQADHHRY